MQGFGNATDLEKSDVEKRKVTEMTEDLIKQAATEIKNARYAIALSGAGISTDSGIPDFRGPNGIWTKNPELEQKAYDAFLTFKSDPRSWWIDQLEAPVNLIEEWGKARPNSGHLALADLEKRKQLKWVITQNIDSLHQKAGSKRVIDYHGNIFKLRCLNCNRRYPVEKFNLIKLQQKEKLPPCCKSCRNPLKPDVVYFGEAIPPDVAAESELQAKKCDLMIVCGTSAVVYPFAGLPQTASGKRRTTLDSFFVTNTDKGPDAIIIEVNNEPTPLTQEGITDIFIQGNTSELLPRIISAVDRL